MYLETLRKWTVIGSRSTGRFEDVPGVMLLAFNKTRRQHVYCYRQEKW